MSSIFNSTKIRLTGLYLAIIMFVTVSFSFFIFSQVNEATKHAMQIQKKKIEKQFAQVPPEFRKQIFLESYQTEALLEIRENVLYNLIVVNLTILVVSASLGYYLAGKTLKPIEEMVAKQKRFISDAAHELKTPLTAIKTDIEVTLRDKNLTKETTKEALNRTLQEVDELTALTNHLLAASKYNNGDVYKKDIKSFKLNESISKVVKKYEPKAKDKDIEIKLNLSDVEINADQVEVEQVLSNVIDNAIKYSGRESEVKVSLTKEKNNAIIKVKDSGQGISQENQERIFEPFYRGDKSRTNSKTEGYGLGLAITKDIVQSYGGNILVVSQPQKGSTFTITLACLP